MTSTSNPLPPPDQEVEEALERFKAAEAAPGPDLTKWGIGVSLFWGGGVALLMCLKWDSSKNMPLNEWGDFFAGVFSPLAFFWLVLGFLQQGRELRLSSKALLLQVHELSAAVKQQQALVGVARQSYEAEIAAHERQRERDIANDMPRLVFSEAERGAFLALNGAGLSYTMKIRNDGAPITNLHFSFSPELPESLEDISALGAGEEKHFQIVVPREQAYALELSFENVRRQSLTHCFEMTDTGKARLRFVDKGPKGGTPT